ncbi:MAG TPA: hypothetical protein VNJ04_05080 [Gemmatimonadaceae bacterium]|nr:hypothetical protein [Gemmatimonadaceae bacterium]
MRSPYIHVLYIQSSAGWYAQCLEYDVAAQGRSQDEAERSFLATWSLQAQIDRENGEPPFSTLGRAPAKYFEMAKGQKFEIGASLPPDDLPSGELEADADDSSDDVSMPEAHFMAAEMIRRDSSPASAP